MAKAAEQKAAEHRFEVIVGVKFKDAQPDDYPAEDTRDALMSVDVEKAIAAEIAQQAMVLDEDVQVTVYDAVQVRRFQAHRAPRKTHAARR
jgi:hypothetical protein